MLRLEVHYEGKHYISYQRITSILRFSEHLSFSLWNNWNKLPIFYFLLNIRCWNYTYFYFFTIKTWKKLITHTCKPLQILAYICFLKMQLLLCELPLLKLLDAGSGLFSFLQFSENTAYILPSYLLHTDDTSVYICLLGMADFLVLSSAPKQNAKAKNNQYKSLWLSYWMRTALSYSHPV